jgi:hypothetical protein
MVMPFEATPAIFFNDSSYAGLHWSKELYKKLLPSAWQSYRPIYESYDAGAIGRSEIIMHGTTINPNYYKKQPYFPQTPSMGCLCSYEEWDSGGQVIKSNQQEIVNALNAIGAQKGFVVVINLDDKKEPVSVREITSYLH